MNVPLKALSWAARLFWIIALAFAITCAYSASLISLDFEEPIVAITNERFLITMPIAFDNKGYYNIANLNITTLLVDHEGRQISRASTHEPTIPPQHGLTVMHNVSFKPEVLFSQEDYLFHDSNITLEGSVCMDYASVVPFGLKSNATIPWGAPFFNLTAQQPEYISRNATHSEASVPISFQNHSPYFDLSGTIRVQVFNSRHQLIGEGIDSIEVPPLTSYDSRITWTVDSLIVTEGGQTMVYIETEVFSFGPLVMRHD